MKTIDLVGDSFLADRQVDTVLVRVGDGDAVVAVVGIDVAGCSF